MTDIIKQAQASAERHLQMDEDRLYEELGMTVSSMAVDVSVAGTFEPATIDEESLLVSLDSLRKLGMRIFDRWNREAHKLICGDGSDEEDRKDLLDAIGLGEGATIAALTGLLITSFGVAPPVAALVAAIAVKRFFRGAYEE
ncbi:MAG: hypothetical protein AAF456_10200, partial [Planctomycetota bacterium]